MTIPTVTPEAARLTVSGLMNQIHELMDQSDFRAWEQAAAKGVEMTRALARAADYLEKNPECPVLKQAGHVSGSEVNQALGRLAS